MSKTSLLDGKDGGGESSSDDDIPLSQKVLKSTGGAVISAVTKTQTNALPASMMPLKSKGSENNPPGNAVDSDEDAFVAKVSGHSGKNGEKAKAVKRKPSNLKKEHSFSSDDDKPIASKLVEKKTEKTKSLPLKKRQGLDHVLRRVHLVGALQ